MRHRKSGRKLNKKSAHLKIMFRNMACSLFRYEIIKTTLAKAKELRKIIEPLITIAKKDSIHHRRIVFSNVRNNFIVSKLFNDYGPFFLKRPGGYTHIFKCGYRKGDNAPIAYIKFVGRLYSNVIK